MASNIKANGVDLDDIFKPRGAEPARPNVDWKVGGVDIAQRYYPSTYPAIDDRPPANTNLLSGGTDLRNLFRSTVFAGGPGPTITTQPVSLVRSVGMSATFTVAATGTGTLSYQWKRGGVSIPGATSFALNIPAVSESDESSDYNCEVTDTVGTTPSNYASLLVGTGPGISTQPVGATIYVGNVLNVYVIAYGDAPISYQWRKDGVPIPGANSAAYSFTTTSTTDSGTYSCLVSNPYGGLTSDPAVVTVLALGAPTITTHPVGGTLVVGNVLGVYVVATGDPPLSYQWRKNGINILGETDSSYSYTTTATTDSGSYDCVVTNPAGSVTSNPAVITVIGIVPTITTQPVGGDLNVGDALSLFVTASGSTPLSYQWRKDGVPIGGATSATYTTTVTAPTHAGTYECVVSNTWGSDTSDPAIVTINAIVPFITSHPVGGAINIGDVLNLEVSAGGTPPLSYQWRIDGYNIPGATGTIYTKTVDALSDAGTYTCIVFSAWGGVISNPAVVTVNASGWAPVVTTHPVGGSINIGDVLGLYVIASGVAPLSYQWQKNGVAIEGENASTYSKPVTSVLQSGGYECLVSNPYGNDLSNTAAVSVNAPIAPYITSHPVGGSIDIGNVLNLVVGAGGTGPLSYQWRQNGSNLSGATANSSTFTRTVISTSQSGNYDCVVSSPYGSVTSNVATVTVNPAGFPPTITGHPVGGSINVGDTLGVVVSASGTVPLSYQWRKSGVPIGGATGSSYSFTTTTPFNSGSYDCVVSNPFGSVTSSAAYITVSDIPPNITGGTVTGGPYNFNVGDFAHFYVSATGTNLNYTWYKNGSPTGHTGPSGPSFNCTGPENNGTYSVTVSNFAGSDSAAASLTVAGPVVVPPNITGGTVTGGPYNFNPGDYAMFTVSATGTSLNYTWYKNGSPTGHTGPSGPSFNCTGPENNGTYMVVVYNSAGTDSASASLTVS